MQRLKIVGLVTLAFAMLCAVLLGFGAWWFTSDPKIVTLGAGFGVMTGVLVSVVGYIGREYGGPSPH